MTDDDTRPDHRRLATELADALQERTMHTTVEVAWLEFHGDGGVIDARRDIAAVHFDTSRNVIEIVTCPGGEA